MRGRCPADGGGRITSGEHLPGAAVAFGAGAAGSDGGAEVLVGTGDRGKPLSGEIAKALMAKAPELLAEPPKIEKADVLGVKLPG